MKGYFATVCFMPVFLIIFLIWYSSFFESDDVVLHDMIFYCWMALCIYMWVGMILLLVHLWKSPQKTPFKTAWTFVLVMFGLVFLPVFWVRYFHQLDSGRIISNNPADGAS